MKRSILREKGTRPCLPCVTQRMAVFCVHLVIDHGPDRGKWCGPLGQAAWTVHRVQGQRLTDCSIYPPPSFIHYSSYRICMSFYYKDFSAFGSISVRHEANEGGGGKSVHVVFISVQKPGLSSFCLASRARTLQNRGHCTGA